MPDSLFDLNQTHELYRELEPVRRRSRDLVGGSVPVKKAREDYLFRTQNETSEQYDLRLKRAVYDNWPRVVVDSRQALLFNKMPTRKLPLSILDQERNVDGRGTFADAFFQSVAEAAAIDGLSWILIDAPRETSSETTTAAVLTRRDEQDLGLSARFVHLLASDVLDWSWGSDALLDYVVIRQDKIERPGPGLAPQKVSQRLVWERSKWTLYRAETDKGAKALASGSIPGALDTANAGAPRGNVKWVVDAQGANELGVVPVVPVYGIFAADGLGWPVVVDVLDHAVSIYNKFSDRDLTEYLSNNPIPYIIAPQNPGTIRVNQGNGIFLQSGGALAGGSGGEVRIGYLEPTGSALSASRESERDLIGRIFLIALKQARKATAQVQSADSIRGEGRVFSASLSATAARLEDVESLCWLYVLGWKGEVDLNSAQDVAKRLPQGSVEYSRDFDDEVLEATLMSSLAGAVRDGLLSRRTFIGLLKQNELLPDSVDVEDELRQIEDDAFSAAGSMPGFGRAGGVGAAPDEGAAA